MSRIHEALKKAEESRAQAPGQQADPARVLSIPPPGATPINPGLEATAAGASFSPGLTFETLIARCQPSSWTPDKKTMLFFNAEEHVPGTEEFRTLRSRLYQIREKQKLKKVLVTSSLPKEGKSFVAANLSQALARQEGRRVLLIDADLRGARLHLALGTSAQPGLAEYLLGESDEFGIIQRGAMENLFFVPSGRAVSSPAELVANGKLRMLLERVESIFDWIIIDSPPAVPVSDASLLANFCDGVLMVVRSSATPFDAAQKARLEFRDHHLIGVVLNGIDAGSSDYNRYYYNRYGRPNGGSDGQR